MSYSITSTQTFTVTHAKYLASKVATDLKRIQRYYGSPSDVSIEMYEAELVEFLKKGYLNTVTFGFKRDGKWIEPTLRYTAGELSYGGTDDDPGRIRPGTNVAGASFASFLTYSQAYFNAPTSEKDSFEKALPFSRTPGTEPGINGYLSADKTYASGGRSLDRSSLKGY
ncbi:hypothetical protein GCM10027275_49790 [Rhabdobacter roseus]|uniref:Bacterial HORMA domain-containing protein n=1 Tax=Rhabdobacter roseus TaxID=1655419 RepID=A0A840TZI6_9BACT|nr:hypothetical protein [Rhabdobacter roseus]MBB5287042.1 hypothetical protein [Rhabdobacter roseus]